MDPEEFEIAEKPIRMGSDLMTISNKFFSNLYLYCTIRNNRRILSEKKENRPTRRETG
jgi:hypothetical protein